MSTAFIIIVGLALGISGYCVGFYAGVKETLRSLMNIVEEYTSKQKESLHGQETEKSDMG